MLDIKCVCLFAFLYAVGGLCCMLQKKKPIGTVSYFWCVLFWFTPEKDKNGLINHIDKGKLMDMTLFFWINVAEYTCFQCDYMWWHGILYCCIFKLLSGLLCQPYQFGATMTFQLTDYRRRFFFLETLGGVIKLHELNKMLFIADTSIDIHMLRQSSFYV